MHEKCHQAHVCDADSARMPCFFRYLEGTQRRGGMKGDGFGCEVCKLFRFAVSVRDK